MKNLSTHIVIFYLFSLFIAICAVKALADCSSLSAELTQANSQIAADKRLLNANQTALDALASGNTGKRIKITSNIMILTARIETNENNNIIKNSECQKQRCPSCPKI